MSPAEYLQYIRRANQQAPLKLIESLRAEGFWVLLEFHPDGRVASAEITDPPPADYVGQPGVSILHPIPYGASPTVEVVEVSDEEAEAIRASVASNGAAVH